MPEELNQPSAIATETPSPEPTPSPASETPAPTPSPTSEGAEPSLDAGLDEDVFADFDLGDELGEDEPEHKPVSLKESVDSLRKGLTSTDPKVVKETEKTIKRNQNLLNRFQENFKTPEDARAVVEKLETLGGVEKVERSLSAYANLERQFAAGDPAVIEGWASRNPHGMAKIMPTAMKKWAELDSEAYSHHNAAVFVATADKLGMLNALQSLFDIPAVVNDPAAKRLLDKLTQGFNAVNERAEKAPVSQVPDKALTERETSIKQREVSVYQQQVSSQTTPLINAAARNILSKALGTKKVTPEARKALLSDLVGTKDNPIGEYARLLRKDSTFQANAKALLIAGETDKFLKLVRSALQRTMPLAARNVVRKYFGISGLSGTEAAQRKAEGQSRQESGGGGVATNEIKENRAPKAEEVDWDMMKLKGLDLLDGAYYKKGDKQHVLRRFA